MRRVARHHVHNRRVLLEDVQRRVARALFTGESDRKNVVQQFQEFSSIISRGVAQRAVFFSFATSLMLDVESL